MTEIGDERQWLVADLELVIDAAFFQAAALTRNETADLRRRLLAALASPSEGNQSQTPERGDTRAGQAASGVSPLPDPAHTSRSGTASRPQEQPRKATGEFPHTGTIEKLLTRLGECPDNIIVNVHAGDLRALGASVSPAAAQGWQTMETAPKDGTHILARGVRGEASPPTTVHWFGPPDLPGLRAGGWYISVQQNEGPRVHPTAWMPLPAVTPAAPPSPQEQENKERAEKHLRLLLIWFWPQRGHFDTQESYEMALKIRQAAVAFLRDGR